MNEISTDQKHAAGFCIHGNKPPCEACSAISVAQRSPVDAAAVSIESSEQERQQKIDRRKTELANDYPNNLNDYREVMIRNGQVKDLSQSNPDQASRVPTDTAAIFEGGVEVASGNFYGCGALFLFDGKKTLLAHMTPSNRLQYLGWQVQKTDPVSRVYVDESLQRIVDAAKAAGMDLTKTTFKLIAEPGTSHQNPTDPDISKYSIESMQESFNHLREILASQGIDEGEVIESTVSDFTVIYSPEEQGVYVTGFKNEYVNGVLRQSNKKEDVKTNFVPVRV